MGRESKREREEERARERERGRDRARERLRTKARVIVMMTFAKTTTEMELRCRYNKNIIPHRYSSEERWCTTKFRSWDNTLKLFSPMTSRRHVSMTNLPSSSQCRQLSDL